MAHFAEIQDGVVLRVLVIPDAQEYRGQDYLAKDLGLGGEWVQTSHNGSIRKNYAGIGYTFDKQRDAFVPPQPFTSWVLDEQKCSWEPPIAYPLNGKKYRWDEAAVAWVQLPESE